MKLFLCGFVVFSRFWGFHIKLCIVVSCLFICDSVFIIASQRTRIKRSFRFEQDVLMIMRGNQRGMPVVDKTILMCECSQ